MAQFNAPAKKVVLIVEDEPLLRMLAVDVAENAGFDTAEARTADEAIETLQARTDIRIVSTDVYMPGSMNGLMLAFAVRERWPPIDMIVSSSHRTFQPRVSGRYRVFP